MWVIFFCLFYSVYISGSGLHHTSNQANLPAIIYVVTEDNFLHRLKQVKITYKNHDPYRLYRLYNQGRPKPSHTRKRIVILYKELDKAVLNPTLKNVDKIKNVL